MGAHGGAQMGVGELMAAQQMALTGVLAGAAPCARCGVPCRPAASEHPDARLMQHTTGPTGYCECCALTAFLVALPFTALGIERAGSVAAMLAAPHVREQIGQIFLAGQADARIEQIDWQRVVDQWNLPFPMARRGKGRRA